MNQMNMASSSLDRTVFWGTLLFGLGVGLFMVGLRKVFETPSGFYPLEILLNYFLTFVLGSLAGWLLGLGQLGIRGGTFSQRGYLSAVTVLGIVIVIVLAIMTIVQLGL